jgi:glycerophosphoryl diester phosphodiesterase
VSVLKWALRPEQLICTHALYRYLGGTADHRTDLYSTCGTPVSHSESIEIMKAAGRKFTPELKAYTQGDGMPSYDTIRQKIMDEYAGVSPSDVWLQSFVKEDVMYWINHGGNFGHQAVYLDDDYTDGTSGGRMDRFEELAASGVKILAPPMQMLVKVEGEGYAPSNYATQAKAHGFELITWTLERSGPLASGGGWYYGTSNDYTSQDGDMLDLTHTLVSEVGVLSLFSDWPASVTFYANCMMKPLSPAGSSCDPLAPACALGTSCKKSAGMPKRGMRNLLFATTVADGMNGVNGCASYMCM